MYDEFNLFLYHTKVNEHISILLTKMKKLLGIVSYSSSIIISAMSLGVIANQAQAQVIRIDESDFLAGSGLITFSEFPIGTVNPTYSPADYGGGVNSPTVTFEGYFLGQSLSANPGVDCPGGIVSGCVVGTPTALLTLDSNAPDTFITTDVDTPTSPVLSGTPQFNGPVSILFDMDVAGVGLDGGFFNAPNSMAITAFDRNGNELGMVSNIGTGIEFLGLVTADKSETIAGIQYSIIGNEPFGFTIDNLRFGFADEIDGGGPTQTPESSTLFGILAIGSLCLAIRRK